MPEFPIRKIAVLVEEIFHEGGPVAAVPRRRAAAMALVKNPFAGRYVGDLQPAMDDLKPLGLLLSDRLIAALGGDAKAIDGYGKGAIVGTAGELEHGALWHVPGGYAMRERLGDAKAIVPSAKKVGAFGAGSTCRSAISTPPMCAAISTPWRSASATGRAPTRSCSAW